MRTCSSPPSPSTASATSRSSGWPGGSTRSRTGALTAVVVSSELRRIGDLRVLRRAAQPAPPQRGLGTEGQLPRRADRLPAARRAAGLDRRHRGLRPDGGVPLRRRRLPPRLAAGSGRRAAGSRRDGAVRRARRPEVHGAAIALPRAGQHGDLERRSGVGAVGALAGLRGPPGACATSSTR